MRHLTDCMCIYLSNATRVTCGTESPYPRIAYEITSVLVVFMFPQSAVFQNSFKLVQTFLSYAYRYLYVKTHIFSEYEINLE